MCLRSASTVSFSTTPWGLTSTWIPSQWRCSSCIRRWCVKSVSLWPSTTVQLWDWNLSMLPLRLIPIPSGGPFFVVILLAFGSRPFCFVEPPLGGVRHLAMRSLWCLWEDPLSFLLMDTVAWLDLLTICPSFAESFGVSCGICSRRHTVISWWFPSAEGAKALLTIEPWIQVLMLLCGISIACTPASGRILLTMFSWVPFGGFRPSQHLGDVASCSHVLHLAVWGLFRLCSYWHEGDFVLHRDAFAIFW